jgi:hypothetical protein
LAALNSAIEHGMSERSNDVAVIMPTVSSWDQHFALLSSTVDGELQLRLALDREEVERFYVDRINSWLLIGVHGENDVYGQWFKLTDTRGEMTIVATGNVDRNRVVVLFPTWTDGIIGEIMWTEPEWSNQNVDPNRMMSISQRLDDYDTAWRSGDIETRLSVIEANTCSVMRVVDVAGDHRYRAVARSKAELRDAWSAPSAGRVVELRRLSRITTNTYVFATYTMLVEYPNRSANRETAVILPLGPNDKFIGELSYSMELSI